MYCNKCSKQNNENTMYCSQCGAPLNQAKPQTMITYTPSNQNSILKNVLIGGAIGGVILIIIFLIITIINKNSNNITISNDVYDNNISTSSTSGNLVKGSNVKKGKYGTAIIYDNTYTGVKIDNNKDAIKLIEQDSNSQKSACPSEIKKIENEIIEKYDITAVNLCELDPNFAKELGNVFEKIYTDYPSARGYFTNLTLVNGSMSENYIAAFMPIFNFATSDKEDTYPWVIKTQMLLNTTYFLNKSRLESSMVDASSTGHFPKNATIYSPVAHELGHYLSFIAMMKNYKTDSILLVDNNNLTNFYSLYEDFGKGNYSLSMINEAYEKYKRDKNATIGLDEWRATISNYALAKDNNGEYIYDETIAESFHDVYLNGNNAKDASKYIVAVLKEKLGGEG